MLQLVVFWLVVILSLVLDTCTVETSGLEELSETLQCPLTIVVDNLVVALLEKLNGGEALERYENI